MTVLQVKNLTIAFPAAFSTEEDLAEARKNSRYIFGEKPSDVILEKVLDDVSFDLRQGEILGLVGESGSGKSMSGYSIAKLLSDKAPTARLLSGEILFDGKDILSISERDMRKKYRGKRISTIFQDAKGTFSPVAPIGPQIAEMFMLHKKMGRKQAKKATIELLEKARITNPAQAYGKITEELSGGEAQRANIAMMALATKPDILIADEATTALDVTVQAETLDYLESVVRENGISLILITHDFGLIAEYTDRVVVLNKGIMVESGSTEDVFYSPKSGFVKGILKDLPRIDKRIRGINSRESFPRDVVVVENASVRFPKPKEKLFGKTQHDTAVEDVSISLGEGEILGIVGESGSGKSTLMRTILNILPEDALREGSVRVLDKDVYALSEKELRKTRQFVGGVPQGSSQSLTPFMRILDIVGEALDIHNLYQAETRSLQEIEKRNKVLEILRTVELPAEKTIVKFRGNLSGGEQQRIAIARALMVDPKVLVLDEPTASLDASRKNTILKLLIKLHEERNLSLIIISHELPTIASICDRVAVMQEGRIVEVGSPQQVFKHPKHAYTRRLLASVPIPDPKLARQRIR